MRLNPDCIRDILLVIENTTTYHDSWDWDFDNFDEPLLNNYSHEEIMYHILQCKKAGLVDGCEFYYGGDAGTVSDLSPYGHQFLADIRSESVWNKTKDIAQNIGSNSLDVLKQISSGVLTALIQSYLRS